MRVEVDLALLDERVVEAEPALEDVRRPLGAEGGESRGDDRSREHADRFADELKRLQERWHTREFVDPHYSPLFSRLVERCVLAPSLRW